MTLELFHHLIKINEFGKAREIAIKLKLSDQVIADAIRYKKADKAWSQQLEWDRFWNAIGFKRKDKEFGP